MELLITIAVIALVLYGLQHNHHKHPAPRLSGSTDPFTRRHAYLTPRTPGV